jgi:hypothetical protein
MSTLSPFREDIALQGSPETAPVGYEGETWYAPEVLGSAPLVTEQEDEAFDFGEAEAEVAHPILSLFPVPPAVLEALSNGMASVAIGLAINAGYRDVNQLTNIVFYFRHPNLIGRKIQPDERELAAEWISIRDRLAKPALQAPLPPVTAPAPVVPAPPRVVTATVPAAVGDRIPSSGLSWEGATDEQFAFMRAVYDRAVENAKRPERRGDEPRVFNRSLRRDELDKIEGHWLRVEAVPFARDLLAAARAALAAHAPKARLGILSAYRSADEQYMIWQGKDRKGRPRKGKGFPHYYAQMLKDGRLRPGDYGPHAVELMAAEMGGWIAAPGYSNHQDGRAIDFGIGEAGGDLGTPKDGSWFHKWLKDNAATYRFHPYWKEAWHWTYKEPAIASEVWAGEIGTTGVRAGKVEVPTVPLLAHHRGVPPDLILRWNDMASAPEEIDVVVHLHGYWYAGMELPRDIEPVSGLDLVPIKGATGQGRARPTLTVLPRADDTGVRQRFKQKDGSYKYGYNQMKFPALVTKDGLTELVRLSLDRFAAEVGGAAPRVGRLILTAHSGGGQALVEILKHNDPHQVHVFDALYWPPDTLVDWARRRIRQDKTALAATDAASARDYMAASGGALRVFFADRFAVGTKPYSRQLRKAIAPELGEQLRDWYRVEASKYDHFQIPRRYGWRVLADASADVPDAYVERAGRRETEANFDDLFDEDDAFEEELPPLSTFREPVSQAQSETAEWDPELFAEDEEVQDFEFEDEEPSWEVDGETYALEPEELEDSFEDLYWHEPQLEEEEEAPTSVTFPSGATLTVVSGPAGPGEEFHDPWSTGNPLLDTSASVRSTLLSKNFTTGELAYSGGNHFDKARIDPKLVELLQKLREYVDKPISIVSSYRPYLYNIKIYTERARKRGTTPKPTQSRHSSGQAADVKIKGMTGVEIAKAAIDVWGTELGVGIDDDNAHVDVRPEWSIWTYPMDAPNQKWIDDVTAHRKTRLGGRPSAPPAHDGTGARMLEALGRGLWDTAVQIAIGTGITDANQLTNMLFYLHHPDLRGKLIEPDQRDLAREWIEIRNRWVKPALDDHKAAQTAPAAPAPHRGSRENERMTKVLRLLEAYRGDIPLDFLLGWVYVESNGVNELPLTPRLEERGYFQVSKEESQQIHADHERISRDPDYSIQAGVKLVRYYAAFVRKAFPWATDGTEFFWRLVKFVHAMGLGDVPKLIKQMQREGVEPSSWEAIARYGTSEGDRLQRFKILKGKPARFIANVDKVYVEGRRFATVLVR